VKFYICEKYYTFKINTKIDIHYLKGEDGGLNLIFSGKFAINKE